MMIYRTAFLVGLSLIPSCSPAGGSHSSGGSDATASPTPDASTAPVVTSSTGPVGGGSAGGTTMTNCNPNPSMAPMVAGGAQLPSPDPNTPGTQGNDNGLGNNTSAAWGPAPGSNLALTASAPNYNDDIGPYFNNSCASGGCHSAGGTLPDLSSYSAATTGAASALASMQAGRMPRGGGPQAADTAALALWVQNGMPQTASATGGSADGTSPGGATPAPTSQTPSTGTGGGATASGGTNNPCGPASSPMPSGGTGTGTTTGASSSGFDPGPGLEGCNAKGLAWVPGFNGTLSACGASLANFCCTEAEIYARFPTMQSQIQSQFANYEGKGQKLYNCAVSGTTYTFYLFSNSGNGAQSGFVTLSGLAAGRGTAGGQCTKLTSADLGITAAGSSTTGSTTGQTTGGGTAGATTDGSTAGGTTSGGTGTTGGATTGGTTASGTTTGGSGAVPAAIAPLTNTGTAYSLGNELQHNLDTQTGYRAASDWATGGTLQQVPVVRGSPHNGLYVREYWSENLAQALNQATLPTTLPMGSVAIFEAYTDRAGTQFSGWYLMAKATADAGAASWLMYGLKAGNLEAFGMGAMPCAGCHSGSNVTDMLKKSQPY